MSSISKHNKIPLKDLDAFQKLERLCVQLNSIHIEKIPVWDTKETVVKCVRTILSDADVPTSLLTIHMHETKEYAVVDLSATFAEELRHYVESKLAKQSSNNHSLSLEQLYAFLVQKVMAPTIAHVHKLWNHVFQGRQNYRGNGPQHCDRLWIVGLFGCQTIWNNTTRSNERYIQVLHQHQEMREPIHVNDYLTLDDQYLKRHKYIEEENKKPTLDRLNHHQSLEGDENLDLLSGFWKKPSGEVVAQVIGWNPVMKRARKIIWHPNDANARKEDTCCKIQNLPDGCSFALS